MLGPPRRDSPDEPPNIAAELRSKSASMFMGSIVYSYAMKTTFELPDALFGELKQFAAEHNLTLRAVMERALREFLNGSSQPGKPFRLKDGAFRGQGLQPGLSDGDWNTIKSMANPLPFSE